MYNNQTRLLNLLFISFVEGGVGIFIFCILLTPPFTLFNALPAAFLPALNAPFAELAAPPIALLAAELTFAEDNEGVDIDTEGAGIVGIPFGIAVDGIDTDGAEGKDTDGIAIFDDGIAGILTLGA